MCDGWEKVTKFVEIQLKGAKNDDDADKAARCIANSLLVKSSGMVPTQIGEGLSMLLVMRE